MMTVTVPRAGKSLLHRKAIEETVKLCCVTGPRPHQGTSLIVWLIYSYTFTGANTWQTQDTYRTVVATLKPASSHAALMGWYKGSQ